MFYGGAQEVIPNGMPDQVFTRIVSVRSHDRPITFATILVGWGGYKNGHVAIEGFSLLRKHYPNARLIMFGAEHEAGGKAEQWARSHGLEQGIEFVGQVPYDTLMERVEAEVDVLVHPALEEAQPMAIIEAMARRIPVIGGKASGGVPWTLDEGRAGILVDVRSPDQLATAMQRLAADSVLRQDLAERGQALARERFHISAVADAWQAIYAQLVEDK